MAKSTASQRPGKPYPDYPLYPHPSGRWGKRVGKSVRFFGRWGTKSGDSIVPVDDVEASAASALNEFNRQWPYLREGKTPPSADAATGCTIRELCNQFLTAKENRVETGELTLHSFQGYRVACEQLIEFFGRDRRVADLRPDDFESFRRSLAQGCGVVTLKSKINRLRVVLKFASDSNLIDRPVNYGKAFDRPSEKVLRKARNEAGERMFEADELRKILAASDPEMKAMILMGLNCGFGNTDISSVPKSALDLQRGWVNFPRPKTAVRRRIPLWPETVAALWKALEVRPAAADSADDGLCFITERGTRYVRVQQSLTKEGHYVTINALARRFELLLNRLKIERRRGLGFYTLRHVFETIGGECRDQVAVDACMGHVDPSMGENYRQRISDDRLRNVVNTVRTWLFPPARKPR